MELRIFGEFSSLDLWVASEVTAAAWKFGLSSTTIVWYASVVGAVVRARTGSLVGFSFFLLWELGGAVLFAGSLGSGGFLCRR